jgi:hypothetical protein
MMKNPKKRPTVKEIVTTHYVISHISKLLSYTLKMGKGGAENAVSSNQEQDDGDIYRHGLPDPEEVDRNIERERERQRQEEKEQMKLDRENQVFSVLIFFNSESVSSTTTNS